jgi:NIPSNAP protein
MIFEMRTYTLKHGTLPEVEERFGSALPGRVRLSPLGGFWRTEVGTLNQIIHIWPYESVEERGRIRAEAIKQGVWPPKIQEFLVDMETKILNAAPFSPPFEERQLGSLYEFRTYTYAPGCIPRMLDAWGESIGARTKLSPLAAAGYTEIGPLNQWVHIWAYKDGAERQRVREEAVRQGIWPPRRSSDVVILKQENILAVPARFSPLR